MLKITCPSCQAKMHVRDEHIPAVGGWACCPKCRDRFFINPGGQAAADLANIFQEPLVTGHSIQSSGEHNKSTQRFVEQLKTSVADQPVRKLGDESEDIAVSLTPSHSSVTYHYVGWVFLGLSLLAIVLALNWVRETSRQPESPHPAAIKQLKTEQYTEMIQADLRNIKKDLLRRRRSHIDVDHSGSESRVFNFFMGHLVPMDYCSAIYHMEITTTSPIEGYVATGFCQGSNHSLEMKVSWTRIGATIKFPAYPGQEEFEMYPQTTEIGS